MSSDDKIRWKFCRVSDRMHPIQKYSRTQLKNNNMLVLTYKERSIRDYVEIICLRSKEMLHKRSSYYFLLENIEDWLLNFNISASIRIHLIEFVLNSALIWNYFFYGLSNMIIYIRKVNVELVCLWGILKHKRRWSQSASPSSIRDHPNWIIGFQTKGKKSS